MPRDRARHRRPRRIPLATVGYLLALGWVAGYLCAVLLQMALTG
ncbi:hypothetical protein [Streptomyces mayteni]